MSLSPGTEIAGFRIERVLGLGPAAVVYEATQLDLDRRVALKLLPSDVALGERLRQLHWPEHPNVVSLYAAGVTEHGSFLAMQLVRGGTLADLLSTPRLDRDAVRTALDGVAAAVDAAHRSGTVHGAIRAKDVLIDQDGRGLLSDFGLGPREAAPSDDRVSFAALVREVLGVDTPVPLPATAVEILRAAGPPARRSRLRRTVVAAAIAVLGVAVALAVAVVSSPPSRKAPPDVLPGLVALGSVLSAAHVDSVDCKGGTPNGGSEACTVIQTGLGDRPLSPRRSGVIRRWTVRGARGDLALQVLRRRGKQYFLVARTQYVHVPDERPHVETANLPVRPGDLVGLEVTPGAAIGVNRDDSVAQTARWFGPLVYSARAPEQAAGTGFDRELLLRVEYAPGVVWRPAGELTGHDAAIAPAGRVIARLAEPGVSLQLVRVGGRIAVDLVLGRRRVVRLPVVNADPGGQLVSFDEGRVRFGQPIVRLRWQGAGRFITHDYIVEGGSLTPLSS